MKCVHCKGRMKRGTAPFHIARKGCHLMLERVPAWACEQCGEAYFEDREMDAMQDLIQFIEYKAQVLVATG